MRALLLSALCLSATLRPAGVAQAQAEIAKQGTNLTLMWPSAVGDFFSIEQRASLAGDAWSPLASNLFAANPGPNTAFTHFGGLLSTAGFYRVLQIPSPFTFNWSGTNFTYTDSNRTFTGIMLKPAGNGPFAGVIINHGAGGTATGYSLPKAREMVPWGVVCIGPTLTHAAGGETNPPNMGNCPENNARVAACLNVLLTLPYVDTNRLAIFGHSMGAFNTIGSAGVLAGRLRAAAMTSGGVIPNGSGTNATTNATPTVAEASPVRAPFIMFCCDADPVVPPARSALLQLVLNSNAVPNSRIVYSSNSIAQANWHNLQNDPVVNADFLTNIFQWFKTYGVLP